MKQNKIRGSTAKQNSMIDWFETMKKSEINPNTAGYKA